MSSNEKKDQAAESTPRSFFGGPRRPLYAFGWFLLFCFAASELGLVSQQLHNGGNSTGNYGNVMFKHTLGLLLFTSIVTFLITIGHYFAGVGLMSFMVLCTAVFWGVCAGATFQSTPYRSFNCHDSDPTTTFQGTRWGEPQFFSQCSRIVAIQGIAWLEWALCVIMFFGMLAHLLEVKVRPNTSFYGV